MRMDPEREGQRKSLRSRLIGFFLVMLAAILVSELLVSALTNRLILPAVQAAFLQGTLWDAGMTGSQLAILQAGMALISLLRLFGMLFPASGPAVRQGQLSLEAWIVRHVPQMADASSFRNLSGKELFLLFLIFLGLFLLWLLPYLVFGILYIRYVVRSMDQVRDQDERYYAETEKDRNRMLSDIAHDIRNPITTIAGYAQALDEGMVADPEKQGEYLRAIRKKADRVSGLVQVLFEYAKLNSAGYSLEKKRIDLCELLRASTAEMYTDAEEKGMEIVPEIPEGEMPVTADPLQLSRVIGNLLTNAIRYNDAGTKILVALRTPSRETGDACLVIADTGAAIPAEKAEKIFEPFYRGDEARRTDGGSGLGLSIADTIVRMHGWELSLRTDIAGYTKAFVIRIPW